MLPWNFTPRLIDGDANLEMELAAALAEKRENWKSGDLKCVQDLMKLKCAASQETLRVEAEARSMAAGELEKEEYKLMIGMFQYLD